MVGQGRLEEEWVMIIAKVVLRLCGQPLIACLGPPAFSVAGDWELAFSYADISRPLAPGMPSVLVVVRSKYMRTEGGLSCRSTFAGDNSHAWQDAATLRRLGFTETEELVMDLHRQLHGVQLRVLTAYGIVESKRRPSTTPP